MLEIKDGSIFRKDMKKVQKQGKDFSKLRVIITKLINNIELPKENKDHNLKGNYKGYRECHIEPDWLLIYKTEVENNLLILYRTGSHSELF
jgi:mRNA interferase YafQ